MPAGREHATPVASEKRVKLPSPPKKEPKVRAVSEENERFREDTVRTTLIQKKVMTEREMADAAAGLRALKIGAASTEIEEWIASELMSGGTLEIS